MSINIIAKRRAGKKKTQRKEPPEDMSNFLNPPPFFPLSFIFPLRTISQWIPPTASLRRPPFFLSFSAVQLALSLNIEGMKKNGAF